MPVVLLCSTEDSQILFKGLVGSFTGSIGLGVVRCTDVLVDIQEAAEVCGKFRHEAYVSVRYYFAGDAIVGCYMGGIECGHSFWVDSFVTWEKYQCFGAICVSDREDSVIST